MTSLQLLILALYGGGVILFLAFLVKHFRKGAGAEPEREIVRRLDKVVEEITVGDTVSLVQSPTLLYPRRDEAAVLADRIGRLAMDVNVGILEATRSSERRLSKAAAEELLGVLRDELAVPESGLTPEQMVQSVRARLIRLTELMVEVQLGLADLNHRVTDIDSLIGQLPQVLNSHRDAILSLRRSVEEVRADYATKAEVKSIEKDFEWLKWTFSGILGIILVILGFLLTKL